jgi:alpha-tubulin suppressor-like RCC1 family protein
MARQLLHLTCIPFAGRVKNGISLKKTRRQFMARQITPCSFMKAKLKLIQICLLAAMLLPAVTGGAQPVTRIAAGGYYSLFLKSDGSLWAMGLNVNGQLGDGTYNDTNLPEQILASNVTAIAAGLTYSLLLKSDGSLWAMGDNKFGQLGDGTHIVETNLPEQIVASNVTAIAAGSDVYDGRGPDPAGHSLFLKNDGSLWAMGLNVNGQLGDGTYNDTNLPEMIVTSNVTAIAAGANFSLFLKSDGSLWAMGNNYYGQLGDGTTDNGNYETNLPEQIVASNVIAIAAGGEVDPGHSLFLKSDGSLWAMGYNGYGQLGDGTYNNTNLPEQIVASNVTAIAAGEIHSLFLKNDGSLWAMGYNGYGQLGDGTYNNTNLPEQIVANNVTAIAAGGEHSLFLKSDGSLWAMGANYIGQLGDGTTDNGNFTTNLPEQIVAGTPGYNQISVQLLETGDMQLSYVGIAGTNYELDQSFSLTPPNWMPQVTNPAGAGGVLVFTNTPNPATNNFWRIRSVP